MKVTNKPETVSGQFNPLQASSAIRACPHLNLCILTKCRLHGRVKAAGQVIGAPAMIRTFEAILAESTL
jgi:hypothetical protein